MIFLEKSWNAFCKCHGKSWNIGKVKGQVAWISEKQRLPVKTSGKASFYVEKLHCGLFYDWLERDYVIYVHIDVNLDGRGVGVLLLDRQ